MGPQWGHLRAEEVGAATGGTLSVGRPDTLLSGISTDSRTLTSGQVFWALRGERYDGHHFLRPALDNGAAALVVEQGFLVDVPLPSGCVAITVGDTLKALGDFAAWWRRAHGIQVAAITGSAVSDDKVTDDCGTIIVSTNSSALLLCPVLADYVIDYCRRVVLPCEYAAATLRSVLFDSVIRNHSTLVAVYASTVDCYVLCYYVIRNCRRARAVYASAIDRSVLCDYVVRYYRDIKEMYLSTEGHATASDGRVPCDCTTL